MIKDKEIGKYVYVDCFHKIHIDRRCVANLVENPKTKDERMANMQGVRFIDTCELRKGIEETSYMYYEYKFCPKCIDDGAYRHLNAMMDRNEVKPPAY